MSVALWTIGACLCMVGCFLSMGLLYTVVRDVLSASLAVFALTLCFAGTVGCGTMACYELTQLLEEGGEA